MRSTTVLALAAALAFGGLAACSSGGGGNSRTIEVDYQTDEFAGVFTGYYPRSITVKPGMTVKFHQTWNGEPHSVTMGTIVDGAYKPLRSLLADYLSGKKPVPDQPPPEYQSEIWDGKLPFLFGEKGFNQTAALPCFAPTEADLPKDPADPCPAKFRTTQPEFDGKDAYYSSGVIPFEGKNANEFEVKLAKDLPDGTYAFYCDLHSVLMSGEINVKKDAKVESQAAINRRGRDEAKAALSPTLKVFNTQKAGQGEFKLPLAGAGEDRNGSQSFVTANEFVPRTIDTKVGEKVTWTFTNDHTISFNVPPYTPIYKTDKNGFLIDNEITSKPAGGWPGAPEAPEGEEEGPPRDPVKIDAGEWDGTGGLHSSGAGWNTGDTYSITFTKAGTYPYACLIHPGQIGKVVVK